VKQKDADDAVIVFPLLRDCISRMGRANSPSPGGYLLAHVRLTEVLTADSGQ